MRKSIAILAFFAMAIPFAVFASLWTNEEILAKGEVIKGNVYLSAGNPVVESDIEGDLIVIAGDTRVNGQVQGDLWVVAGNVWVSGPVMGDVRVMSGNVTLNGAVQGEVIALAGSMVLENQASVMGDVTVVVGEYKKSDSVVIKGTETVHMETKEAVEQRNAQIETAFQAAFWFTQLTILIGLSLVGLAIFALFPKFFTKGEKDLVEHNSAGSSIGIGFAVLFGAPFAILIAFGSYYGYMIGFVLFFAYLYEIFLAMAMAGIWFGVLIKKYLFKSSEVLSWYHVLMGASVLHLITLIPWVGWLVGLIMVALTIGQNMKAKAEYLRK